MAYDAFPAHRCQQYTAYDAFPAHRCWQYTVYDAFRYTPEPVIHGIRCMEDSENGLHVVNCTGNAGNGESEAGGFL